MFESFNYFRQYNDGNEIADYKAFYRKFSNEREFGGDFTNYDHLVKNRFMDIFGHVFNIFLRKHPHRVLDIGCGNGINLPLSGVFPWVEYHALDYAEKAIEKARLLYPKVSFHVGDAFKLEFEAATFDLVILSSVLILYREEADRLRLLAEAARVLKPDGVFVLVVWNDAPLLRWSIRLSRWIGRRRGEKLPLDFLALHFTPDEVGAMAAKSGLRVKQCTHTAHLYGVLESLRYLTMQKYNRTFGKAESEAGGAHPQDVFEDLKGQAKAPGWLTCLCYRLALLRPAWFSMFSVYALSKNPDRS